jgi:hypothetical protein
MDFSPYCRLCRQVAEIDEKQYLSVNAGLTKDLNRMHRELHDANQYIRHLEEEHKEYRNIVSFFLNDFISDLDSFTPEDLQYGLDKWEENKEKFSANEPNPNFEHGWKRWNAVISLCQQLGFKPNKASYEEVTQIKIFIKTLARTAALLEKENIKLKQENESLTKEIIPF